MSTISLCMIVKNEEKYIAQCLNSVKDIVDEIIIVDTGSTDNTIDLAKPFQPKVFQYQWDNNFGKARNYALEHAHGDWILVLDADEKIYSEDIPKLMDVVANTKANEIAFKFHNYTEEDSEENYNTHVGVRLFKNHCFQYEGAIHEQLIPVNQKIVHNPHVTEIRVGHYGYLKSNSGKKKRERNIPIIQKLLDKNPNDSFQLFNMGNEYMSMEDYNKALSYFEQSYLNKNVSLAYCPHLIFRRAACLHYLKRNEGSLKILEEGLQLYPKCTDYEYFKGKIYRTLKRYSLAADSFNKCISMGKAPTNLSFLSDTEEFKAFLELGNIYFLQDDFAKSLSFYLKAIKAKSNHYGLIYKIGEVLNKMYGDKSEVCQSLEKLFANPNYTPNLLVMVDVLLDEKLYVQAGTYFEKIQAEEAYEDDINYLRGRLFFYSKKYEEAFQRFLKVITSPKSRSILPEAKTKSFENGAICVLTQKQNVSFDSFKKQLKPLVEEISDEQERQVLLYFLENNDVVFEDRVKTSIYRILSEILKVAEFDLFEESLEVLNHINSKDVLLDLASIYYNNGYKQLALKNILRSVKELDVINAEAVQILNKEFLIS